MADLYVLVKPVADLCNMKCKYCFYREVAANNLQDNHVLMNEETLENLVKKAIAFTEGVLTMAFQGGEPMLAGLDFYKKVVALQKKYGKKDICIQNHIQTNGLLINEEWSEFFAQNHFFLGISVDGIAETHDANRLDDHGNATFEIIQKKITLLKQKQVPFNIVTVVTDAVADQAEAIYQAYKKDDLLYQQYIPYIPSCEQKYQALHAEKFGTFLNTVFDLWYADMIRGQAVYNRYFENLAALLTGLKTECCGMRGYCETQLVIDSDGYVYPCDFYAIKEYQLGNINRDSFCEITQSNKREAFIKESLVLCEDCAACEFLHICRGGCRRYRQKPTQSTLEVNYLCEGYKIFFQHALPKMKYLIQTKSDLAGLF